MWCHWHCCWHHIRLTALSMALLHSLGWSCDTTDASTSITMPMVSSMALLHILGQDNQIEMQHDFFSYVMPLALASHYTMALTVVHGTDSSTATHTTTKHHIILLNNHLNIPNTILWLMAPSANHVIAVYMTKLIWP